jgi:hypothetical protein
MILEKLQGLGEERLDLPGLEPQLAQGCQQLRTSLGLAAEELRARKKLIVTLRFFGV